MSKVIQLVLLLFVFGIVGSIPFLLGNALSINTTPTQTLQAAAPTGQIIAQPTGQINGVQEVKIYGSASGYSPVSFNVKKGVPVKIVFSADKYAGCGRQLIIKEFGVNAIAPGNGATEIQFTPNQEGSFTYRCSMGMMRGTMTVTA